MARACVLLAMCGACGFDHGVDVGNRGDDGGTDTQVAIDASQVQSDGPPADARMCFGTFQPVCLMTLPTNDYAITTETTINTDTGCPIVATQSAGQTLCVVAARTMHIDAPLRAQGPRPLVLLATETIDVGAAGLVDVGSYKLVAGTNVTEVIGAGAASGAPSCGNPQTGSADTGMNAGGGGGAGGSFAGKGGAGARGANNNGGNGGQAANATNTPSFMRGGCRGSSGGSGNFTPGALAGAGGGAVLVVAGTSIANAGQVRAGGMGGYGAGNEAGGGGGGSGGMLVLDAPAITNTGILNANGAGGGEGGGSQSPGDGGSSALTGMAAADGGTGNINGGDGGPGSWSTTLTGGNGATAGNGGGGGGGGAGVIRIYPTQTLAGTVSPGPS
jgi:hypothetical protein